MSATDIVGFAAFGCVCAVLVYGALARRTRRAWAARQPTLWAQWASMPRRVRVQIRRGLRRGDPPPAEYAVVVLGLLEHIDALWLEVPSANRRGLRRTGPILSFGIASGALLIALAHSDGQAIGVIIVGYMVTLTLFALRSVLAEASHSRAPFASNRCYTRNRSIPPLRLARPHVPAVIGNWARWRHSETLGHTAVIPSDGP
jgi:hypothetical protein